MKLWAAWCERARLSLLLLGLLLCCPSLENVYSNVARLRHLMLNSNGGRLRLGGLMCVIGSKPGTCLSCWRLEPRRRKIGYHRRHRVSRCRCVV